MGALVTVMVSPHLADGCAVGEEAAAALVADGWTASGPRESVMTTMSGMTIAEFLEARIAEDEATVSYPAEHERPGGYSYADVGGMGDVLTVGTDRVQAECAFKHWLIGTYSGTREAYLMLRAMATVYSDHPDYLEEWQP